jgi:HAMP domain-containing protein
VSESFESQGWIQSIPFEMTVTFPGRTVGKDGNSSGTETTKVNLTWIGIVAGILILLVLGLIVWVVVHRHGQKAESIQNDLDTMEATVTFTDDVQDELECENPMSDEDGLGSGEFELDSGEGVVGL